MKLIVKRVVKCRCGSVMAWLFISCSFYTSVAGAVETKSFPLPIDIENSYYVRSSMYLRYSFEEYNQSFADFSVKENSPAANQFKKILRDIRDQNVPTAIELSPQSKIAPGWQPSDIFKQTIADFNRLFPPEIAGPNFNKMRIVKQVYAGNDRVISWEVNSLPGMKGRPFIGFSKFKKDQQGGFIWEVGLSDEIQSLIHEPVSPLPGSESLDVFAPIDNVKCAYEYAIPGTTSGHPVYLQFNGKVCDFNVLGKEPNDEILAFYQKTCRLLAQSPESLTDFYTEKSAQKYRKWVEKKPYGDPYWRQKELVYKGRKVFFLLNADPVFIVFYQPFVNAKKDLSDVRYEFIVREPKDNQLRLTNLNYSGFLSQFFDNRELFIDPFLKPLLGNDKTPK